MNSTSKALLESFSSSSQHVFVRLRIYHPFLAIISSSYILWVVRYVHYKIKLNTNLTNTVCLTIMFQVVLGMVNIILSAPLWLQMVHLLTAQIVWISYILFIVFAMILCQPCISINAGFSGAAKPSTLRELRV